MSREAREKSESGIYHVLLLGDNKIIFLEDADVKYFLSLINEKRNTDFVEVYAFCFFPEYAHFIIKEGLSGLSNCFKDVLARYSVFYNKKYERQGRLFADRFKSEPMYSDDNLIDCFRFIHRLGKKAMFSSLDEYLKKSEAVDFEPIMLLFNNSPLNFQLAMDEPVYNKYINKVEKRSLSDDELKAEIRQLFADVEIEDISQLDKTQERKLLFRIKEINGTNNAQIARVLGISASALNFRRRNRM